MLITPGYLEQQQLLHNKEPHYGSRGFNWAYLVVGICKLEHCRDVLDYGCGKGSLGNAVRAAGIACVDYDPAIERFRNARACDLVVSIDVLEHIEPECIDAVVAHMRQLTRKLLFVTICQRLAGRNLHDGRNAHILIRDTAWWRGLFERNGFVVRRDWPSPEGDPHWIALMRV